MLKERKTQLEFEMSCVMMIIVSEELRLLNELVSVSTLF